MRLPIERKLVFCTAAASVISDTSTRFCKVNGSSASTTSIATSIPSATTVGRRITPRRRSRPIARAIATPPK